MRLSTTDSLFTWDKLPDSPGHPQQRKRLGSIFHQSPIANRQSTIARMGHRSSRSWFRFVLTAVFPALASACHSPAQFAKLVKENQVLREDKSRLERELSERDATVASQKAQIEAIQAFSADCPADLFAPVSLEIASLSGGADYNDKPGDDGITVYLRPKDADGHVVKSPGKITIQLLDNTDLAAPRKLAVCTFEDPQEIRKMWYGVFSTQHYTIRCPFPAGEGLPSSRKLLVTVSFLDFLTGRTLTAAKEVEFALPDG